METKEISREGDVDIEFNDPIIVPDTISLVDKVDGRRRLYIQNFGTCPSTGNRRLLGLSELDVSRDIMSVNLVTVSD